MTRGDASLLTAGTPVHIAGRDTRVAHLGGTEERPRVRLEDCSRREDAEALRGEPLWVERGAAPALEEDEFWADDLVGCRVTDGPREVGEVSRVLAYPSCEVLVVGDLLVPLIGDAVRTIDLDTGVVDIDLGFLGEG